MYRIDLDGNPDGPWMGHLLAEPGCIWLAPTRAAALEQAPRAIAGFHGWLRRHGEPDERPLDPGRIAVQIGEVQAVPDFARSGAAVGLFGPDREPVSDADILLAVRRLGYARRDLLELVTPLPAEALDWQPPGPKRSIRQNLIHVRDAQGFYITRVYGWDRAGEILPEPWPEETFGSLNWAMERVVEALLSMPEALRDGEFAAERPAEIWTARKMLRRFLEHEREHAEVIRRTILAWQASRGERPGPVDTRPWA